MTTSLLARITLQILLRVLLVSPELHRQRVAANELALAFGCSINPERGLFLALDAYSMLLASMLQSHGLSWRLASAIVRETWLETVGGEGWLPALATIEDRPSIAAPASRQWFLGAAVAVGRRPVATVQVGMDATYDALAEGMARDGGDWPLPPVGVSLNAALRQLRSNETASGVKLPGERLTVSKDDPEFERFLIEALDYRKAADAHLRAKAKTSKNARRALREMREPA